MYSVPTNDDSPQVQSPHLSKERRQSQEQTEVEAGLPAPEESGNPFSLPFIPLTTSYMKKHVYSILAKSIISEEKKEPPPPKHT